MSWNPALDPTCPTGDAVDAIETLIIPRARDLGDFEVRRALPAPQAADGRAVHLLRPGRAGGVPDRPGRRRAAASAHRARHRHLPVPGEFQHRDSLGSDQMIHPGAVNWMIAGTRRHPFRAHQRRDPAASAFALRHPDLGGAARGGRGRRRPASSTPAKEALPVHRGRGRDGAADPRHRLGRAGAGQDVQRDVLRRRRAGARRAGAAAGRARGPRALCRLAAAW